LVWKITLPPSQIVSMMVFVSTVTDAEIIAVGIPAVPPVVIVDRWAGLAVPVADVVDVVAVEKSVRISVEYSVK
jgi:hypothetical protein